MRGGCRRAARRRDRWRGLQRILAGTVCGGLRKRREAIGRAGVPNGRGQPAHRAITWPRFPASASAQMRVCALMSTMNVCEKVQLNDVPSCGADSGSGIGVAEEGARSLRPVGSAGAIGLNLLAADATAINARVELTERGEKPYLAPYPSSLTRAAGGRDPLGCRWPRWRWRSCLGEGWRSRCIGRACV